MRNDIIVVVAVVAIVAVAGAFVLLTNDDSQDHFVKYYANGGHFAGTENEFCADGSGVVQEYVVNYDDGSYGCILWNTKADGSGTYYRSGEKVSYKDVPDLYCVRLGLVKFYGNVNDLMKSISVSGEVGGNSITGEITKIGGSCAAPLAGTLTIELDKKVTYERTEGTNVIISVEGYSEAEFCIDFENVKDASPKLTVVSAKASGDYSIVIEYEGLTGVKVSLSPYAAPD